MRRPIPFVLAALALSAYAFARDPRGGPDVYGDVELSRPMPVDGLSVQGGGASPAKSAGEARGLGADWLVKNQRQDGGWAAGAWGGPELGSDVATTVVAVLALRRDAAGTDEHRAAIESGVKFVLAAVEEAPKDSPRVRTPEGTQPQHKLGPLVDTHMAALLLGEVAGGFDDATNRRILAALDTAVGKVEMAQADNGAFETTGWAPVISNSIAAQGLNRAAELGRDVDAQVLARNDEWQRQQVSGTTFDATTGAGVELYAVASGMGSARAAKSRAPAMERVEAAAADRVAQDATSLLNGYGSVGGEEMLSYLMISDAMAEKGGKEAEEWQGKVGTWLLGMQNADGSWSGHHCITSTPFTTAAAVMTLGAGRIAQGDGAADAKPAGSWWEAQAVE